MTGAATSPTFIVPNLHHHPELLQSFSDTTILDKQSAIPFEAKG
jgi:hypothetical protein